MSGESGDYDPGPWRHEVFADSHAKYDEHVRRSYSQARKARKTVKDLICPTISTMCRNPLVIYFDHTGSMGDWASVIRGKLAYLDLESKSYMGEDGEIGFGAIGDAYTDDYSLQVRDFGTGLVLQDRLAELVIEQKGGGQLSESYELGALYSARNVIMPNALRPVCVFIGDEKPYDFVDSIQARDIVGVNLQSRLSTDEVFEELKAKFAVYMVRKPYGDATRANVMDSCNLDIHERWVELLGRDHVAVLPLADRVLDVIFGCLAKEAKMISQFHNEIGGRQRDPKTHKIEWLKVNPVLKALEPIHGIDAEDAAEVVKASTPFEAVLVGSGAEQQL